jgi:hypothetical protein
VLSSFSVCSSASDFAFTFSRRSYSHSHAEGCAGASASTMQLEGITRRCQPDRTGKPAGKRRVSHLLCRTKTWHGSSSRQRWDSTQLSGMVAIRGSARQSREWHATHSRRDLGSCEACSSLDPRIKTQPLRNTQLNSTLDLLLER